MYQLVQDMAADFEEKNGSIVCRELLGLTKKTDEPSPSHRTQEYYKKRPCLKTVEEAARIWVEYLQNEKSKVKDEE